MNCAETAGLLRQWDNILVLSHASPDGDTLGSACALLRGLISLGKQVDFRCADEIPPKFQYLFDGLSFRNFAEEISQREISLGVNSCKEFTPVHIVSVDVADTRLLGKLQEEFEGKIELAIDHHGTHKAFAPNCWVEPDSAATAEMIWLLLKEWNVTPDKRIAECVYTGITTDTGCLRYQNATPRTYRIAAETIEAGADAGEINRRMWETKTRAQMEAERKILDTMEYFCGGKCAMIRIPQSILRETGASESDVEGAASLPRQIEGVQIGVTVKEKEDGTVKISLRTSPPANAAEICEEFGGGGHAGAAGCSFRELSMEEAAEKIKEACKRYVTKVLAESDKKL